MSLLEDVFLQDEANEAQELERVIEGDEYDERPRSGLRDSDENSEKENEAEEDKRTVDPTKSKTKRVVKHPRVTLNPARLTGPRGIQVIPDHFKDFKFKGKGHEKEDLDMVLKKLEHWAYRLYPKFEFQDCLKKIETLGRKRPVMVHLHKIRSDQYISEDTVVQKDSSDDEAIPVQQEDEFDKLLQQQIELARTTPAPGSAIKPVLNTPSGDNRSPLMMPKGISSPSISDEQKERMLRNRRLAEERRLQRLKLKSSMSDSNSAAINSEIINENIANTNSKESEDSVNTDKINKRNGPLLKDSSEEENDVQFAGHSIMYNGNKETPQRVENAESKNTVVTGNNDMNKMYVDDCETLINSPSKHSIQLQSNIKDVDRSEEMFVEENDLISTKKNTKERNRSNIIDSSDEECELQSINHSVAVDIHIEKNTEKEAGSDICNDSRSNVDKNLSNDDIFDALRNCTEITKDHQTASVLNDDMKMDDYDRIRNDNIAEKNKEMQKRNSDVQNDFQPSVDKNTDDDLDALRNCNDNNHKTTSKDLEKGRILGEDITNMDYAPITNDNAQQIIDISISNSDKNRTSSSLEDSDQRIEVSEQVNAKKPIALNNRSQKTTHKLNEVNENLGILHVNKVNAQNNLDQCENKENMDKNVPSNDLDLMDVDFNDEF